MASIAQCRVNGLRQSLFRHLLSSSFNCQIRASSLSAIHRGVRRSQKVQQYDDPISVALASKRRGSEWDRRGRLTAKALDGASSPRQAQKLRKKLEAKAGRESRKGRQEEEGEEGERTSLRQTRRKRFMNPNEPFGKDSVVYHLKYGVLKDEAASLKLRTPAEPAPFRSLKPEKGQRLSQAAALEQAIFGKPVAKPERATASERLARPERHTRSEQPRGLERPRYGGLDERRDQRPRSERYERSKTNTRSDRALRKTFDARSSLESQRHRSEDGDGAEVRGDDTYREKGRDAPLVPIKYTTAASQFLYGRSVVKAALEQPRRKLYNLYIYAGDTRRESRDDLVIASAAERRGVPVIMVSAGDQSMLDRMSNGRPHNGFVLEASPLRQPPVTSLGRLEESLGKLGFHVELGYQSKEEEAINGRETFVARKNDIKPKPLVLFLNEILDPGNLGGLLRTASYLGVDAVVMTNRSSSTLTPVVLKSAAGAAEEVSIFIVDSPVEFIERSKKAGWETYAAVAPPDSRLAKIHEDKFLSTDLIERRDPLSKNPCILILGNEGHGLSKQIKMAADYELSIPRFVQDSSVDSLNVSVAAGLLCHAFVKASGVKQETVKRLPRESVTKTVEDDEVRNEESIF